MSTGDLLTTAQAARALGISPQRLRTLLDAGRLPGAYRLGWAWVIPPAALEAVRVRKTGRPKRTA